MSLISNQLLKLFLSFPCCWKIITNHIVSLMYLHHSALTCLKASGFFFSWELHIFLFFKRPSVRHRQASAGALAGSSSGGLLRCLGAQTVPPSSLHLSPAGPSAHELRVALSSRYYDIHPNPHGLRRRSHHVVQAVVGFHTEGQRRVWALEN